MSDNVRYDTAASSFSGRYAEDMDMYEDLRRRKSDGAADVEMAEDFGGRYTPPPPPRMLPSTGMFKFLAFQTCYWHV